ncbi:MAG TPA: erythromycin esterase family protein [Phycisphaerales bacterium]|nr:erythromycin esterase family protein [Phycisphaerales bacterium]
MRAAPGDASIGKDLAPALRPIAGEAGDYDPVIDRIGDAGVVLLGEATHGTHEFYAARAEVTRRLIREKGFAAVAIEGDWPDAYRVNRFVRGLGSDSTARDALGDFSRFPAWMWRNEDVRRFVAWLREHNATLPPRRRAGFYGLDLYSLYRSIDAVLEYLGRIDPPAALRARERYECFDHSAADEQHYGMRAELGVRPSCQQEAAQQLAELRGMSADLVRRDGMAAEDEQFFAEQNARLVVSAERYYREMFAGRENTWNLRDTHMAETLEGLRAHLSGGGGRSKIVVWAHNSHVGDARATEMRARGEHNIGQLVRERHGDDVVLIGFTTYEGTVAAASRWGGGVERKRVLPALAGSYETVLHHAGPPAFLLRLDDERAADALGERRLERAIGVVYRPETERWSHYLDCDLRRQFDVVLHFDRTSAVQPFERFAALDGETPETFPTGL